MNFSRIFANAIARRLAFVLVALLFSFFFSGRAAAYTRQCVGPESQCSKPQAYADCDAFINGNWIGDSRTRECRDEPEYSMFMAYLGTSYVGATFYVSGCPSGRTWNPATNTCSCPGGYKEDSYNPGTCMDDAKCRALNVDLGTGRRSFTGSTYCPGMGCLMTPQDGATTFVNGFGETITSARFEYSGASCPPGSPSNPAPAQLIQPPKPQECTPAGSGQTYCVKPNNEQCHTATTGKQICWQPSQTGEQNDGNIKQTRNAGPNVIPPNLNLPSGDTLVATGPKVTTTTTINNSTVVTTTQNYTTTYGTNPGTGPGTGQPADGTGGGGTTPEGTGSSGGGGTCASPPVTSGDPVGGMIALQAWKTRCELEKNNPTNETGNIANCNAPWTVTGTDQQANKARALREAMCPGSVDSSKYLGDGTGEATTGVIQENNMDLLPGGLDQSGFGYGNACPTIPTVTVFNQTINFNTGPLCQWLTVGGWFVVLMAGLACMRLLVEA